MLKHLARAILGLALVAAIVAGAWASGETLASFGIASGSNPRNLCIFDLSATRNCVTIGSLDSVAHTFTIPTGAIQGSTVIVGGVSGGSANAQTLTAPGFTGATGQIISFVAGSLLTNTGAVTIDAGTGATAVQWGSASGPVALSGGEIHAGNRYLIAYYSGGFFLLNPTNVNTPANVASFSANKNSVNQSLSTNVTATVTFGTAVFNVGGFYNTSTSTWTPPAGKVMISAQVDATITCSNVGFSGQLIVGINKNGSTLALKNQVWVGSNGANDYPADVTVIDQANGTDAYTVFVNTPCSSPSVNGTWGGTPLLTNVTYFQGSEL